MKEVQLKEKLRSCGLRATPKRVSVLLFLSKMNEPVGVTTIEKKFPDMNRTSIYRMLNSMVEYKILSKHDLGHGHYDYKLLTNKHNHHLVCVKCDQIEEVDLCDGINEKAIKQSKKFSELTEHMVTVFGTCNRCTG